MEANPLPEPWRIRLAAAAEGNSRCMAELAAGLDELSRRTISKRQFDVFRRFYYFRSVSTLHSVAATVAAALHHQPPQLEIAKRSVYGALLEEIGSPTGDSRVVQWTARIKTSHPELLLQCLNAFSKHAFHLPDLSPVDSRDDGLLGEFATAYRTAQTELFSQDDLATTLGAAFAQESAARGMLLALRDHLFQPLFSRLPWPALSQAMTYFDVHLSDEFGEAEKQHGEEALQNLAPLLLGHPALIERACQGAERSSQLQSDYFLGVLSRMKAA